MSAKRMADADKAERAEKQAAGTRAESRGAIATAVFASFAVGAGEASFDARSRAQKAVEWADVLLEELAKEPAQE